MIKIDSVEFQANRYAWDWVHIKLGPKSLRKNFPDGQLSEHLYKIRDWCLDQGSDMRYFAFIAEFYFENPADATLFTLRWL